MKTNEKNRERNESGIAIVTTLMLTLLLSILVAAMLSASTSDVLIGGNELRTNQAFYIAEAGIHRASGWFSSKFGADPSGGLFVLPEQNSSNTAGVTGKLSYTDTPYYQPGTGSNPEQLLPTSVKVSVGGSLKNVVLAGASSGKTTLSSENTYPPSYSVSANDPNGVVNDYSYSKVLEDFSSHLSNQTVGEGAFSVKATLVSIIPPSASQPQGTATWLLESNAVITRGGGENIASATLYAYISAKVVPMIRTITVTGPSIVSGAAPGVIGRGMLTWNSASMRVDSYKSSLGKYNTTLPANSFTGQIGTKNVGSRGDIRTNNEIVAGVNDGNPGYINIKNGTVTGNPYATLPFPTEGGTDPITAEKISDGKGGSWTGTEKQYEQDPLIFPAVANPTAPPAGSPNYSWSSKNTGTLPSGNYNNVSVSTGTLTIPPGNYGNIDVSSQGTIVLGVPGQNTVYNLQGFIGDAQATIIYKGPVTINVQNNLDVGAGTDVAASTVPPASIRWNFVGGPGKTISLGGNSAVVGVFYAPNNDLELRGTGDFYGAIAARSVDITGNGAIHVDEDAISGVQVSVQTNSTTSSTVGYTAASYSLWRITQAISQ